MYNWIYKDKEIESIEDFPEEVKSFVYKITRSVDGKFYIGKKNLYTERTKALTKKELLEQTDKRKSKKKKVIAESDWKDYYGSEITLKNDIKMMGKYSFKREIIHYCTNKKQTTYQEVRYQFEYKCLESDNCYNNQILGKFWKKDI
jgi:hypothetical protein